jgi:ABC-type polar amino acid transport system ATPase subunit
MILTTTTEQNLALVAAALALEEMSPRFTSAGPTGSGKSTLIRHLTATPWTQESPRIWTPGV